MIKPKKPKGDINQIAKMIVERATEQKDPAIKSSLVKEKKSKKKV